MRKKEVEGSSGELDIWSQNSERALGQINRSSLFINGNERHANYSALGRTGSLKSGLCIGYRGSENQVQTDT